MFFFVGDECCLELSKGTRRYYGWVVICLPIMQRGVQSSRHISTRVNIVCAKSCSYPLALHLLFYDLLDKKNQVVDKSCTASTICSPNLHKLYLFGLWPMFSNLIPFQVLSNSLFVSLFRRLMQHIIIPLNILV